MGKILKLLLNNLAYPRSEALYKTSKINKIDK